MPAVAGKKCARCKTEPRPSNGAPYCPPCTTIYIRELRASSPVFRAKEWRRELLRRYNITEEEYNRILRKQRGRCAICREPAPGEGRARFHVDHDHRTLRVRGLLCGRCNRALGMFKDKPKIVLAAAAYLQRGLPWQI